MRKSYCFQRIVKDWDNKRVDWILLFKKDKYQWISRWYSKRTASTGNLIFSEILSVVLSSYKLDNQQKSHYENFEFTLKVAQELFLKGLNRDACLCSHLAAEHLAKQLFLKTSLAFKLKYSTELSTKHSEPHRSHEVGAIITEITRISDDMRGLNELSNLKFSLDEFRSKIGEWSSVRYNSPISNQAELIRIGTSLITELDALVIALNNMGSVR